MHFSAFKLYCKLIKCSNAKQLLNTSKVQLLRKNNGAQAMCFTRTVLTRPRELDDLKKLRKDRKEKEQEYVFEDHEPSSEGIGLYGYFLLTIPVITFGLGVWQVERRKWKLALIKDLEEKLKREPIELPENLEDLAKLEYCPIKVKGEFLYDKEFTIGPRSLIVDGSGVTEGKGGGLIGSSSEKSRGYNVITPFKVENRDCTILVNRGWVPNRHKGLKEREKHRVEGTVEITGINRLNEIRPQFVFRNIPGKMIWHYRDLNEMAEYANTDPIFLDMLELSPDVQVPIPGQTRVNLRNEHLSYIVTWFGLAGFTGYYWFRIFIRKKPIF